MCACWCVSGCVVCYFLMLLSIVFFWWIKLILNNLVVRLILLYGVKRVGLLTLLSLCYVSMCLSIVYTQIDVIKFCAPKNGTFGTLQMLLTQEVDAIFGPICCDGKRLLSLKIFCRPVFSYNGTLPWLCWEDSATGSWPRWSGAAQPCTSRLFLHLN